MKFTFSFEVARSCKDKEPVKSVKGAVWSPELVKTSTVGVGLARNAVAVATPNSIHLPPPIVKRIQIQVKDANDTVERHRAAGLKAAVTRKKNEAKASRAKKRNAVK